MKYARYNFICSPLPLQQLKRRNILTFCFRRVGCTRCSCNSCNMFATKLKYLTYCNRRRRNEQVINTTIKTTRGTILLRTYANRHQPNGRRPRGLCGRVEIVYFSIQTARTPFIVNRNNNCHLVTHRLLSITPKVDVSIGGVTTDALTGVANDLAGQRVHSILRKRPSRSRTFSSVQFKFSLGTPTIIELRQRRKIPEIKICFPLKNQRD